jgi:hypothetical protein
MGEFCVTRLCALQEDAEGKAEEKNGVEADAEPSASTIAAAARSAMMDEPASQDHVPGSFISTQCHSSLRIPGGRCGENRGIVMWKLPQEN